MKKRLLSLCLIPTVAIPTASCIAGCSIVDRFITRARQVDGSDWIGRTSGLFVFEDDYEVDEVKKEVTYWNMSELVSTNLVIPNYVMWKGEEYKVILDIDAFDGCSDTLFGIVELNDFFVDIPSYCFIGCENITKVILHNYPTNIGNGAFQYCNSLETIVVRKKDQSFDTFWAMKVEEIGKNAFDYCGISGKILFGSQLKTINYQAFAHCMNLTDVDLSMTSLKGGHHFGQPDPIDDGAFIGSGIRRVILPHWGAGEVLAIGQNAFYDCYNLQTISLVEPDNEEMDLYNGALASCPNFIGFTDSHLQPIKETSGFTLTHVGESCFANDKSLQQAYYLSHMRTENLQLQEYTFKGCGFTNWTFTTGQYGDLYSYAFSFNDNLKILNFSAFAPYDPVPSGWVAPWGMDPTVDLFAYGSKYGVIKVKTGFTTGSQINNWVDWFETQGLTIDRNNLTKPTLEGWYFKEG